MYSNIMYKRLLRNIMTVAMIKNLNDFEYKYLTEIDKYELHPFVSAIKNNDLKEISKHLKTEDKQTLQDGIVFACHFNNPNAALFLINNGVECICEKQEEVIGLSVWEKRFNIMGRAIYYKQKEVFARTTRLTRLFSHSLKLIQKN
jgi:hypothetical protein